MSAGSLEMVRNLLAGGADVNAKNNEGKDGCEIYYRLYLLFDIQLLQLYKIRIKKRS